MCTGPPGSGPPRASFIPSWKETPARNSDLPGPRVASDHHRVRAALQPSACWCRSRARGFRRHSAGAPAPCRAPSLLMESRPHSWADPQPLCCWGLPRGIRGEPVALWSHSGPRENLLVGARGQGPALPGHRVEETRAPPPCTTHTCSHALRGAKRKDRVRSTQVLGLLTRQFTFQGAAMPSLLPRGHSTYSR